MAPFPQDALGRGRAALPGAFPAVPAWKIPVSFPQIPLLPSPAAPPGAPAAPARQSRVLRAGTASPGAREKLLAPGKALEWEVSEGEKNSGLRRADPGSRGRDGSVGSFPRSGCAWGGGKGSLPASPSLKTAGNVVWKALEQSWPGPRALQRRRDLGIQLGLGALVVPAQAGRRRRRNSMRIPAIPKTPIPSCQASPSIPEHP